MTFPSLTPTARTFEPGDYPVKRFRAQSGAETRILYGSSRTGMKLSLTYANITDANAELFLNHYDQMNGTFQTFSVYSGTKAGWGGNESALSAVGAATYRYEGPPQQVQVRPGISTVTVNLIGVL